LRASLIIIALASSSGNSLLLSLAPLSEVTEGIWTG